MVLVLLEKLYFGTLVNRCFRFVLLARVDCFLLASALRTILRVSLSPVDLCYADSVLWTYAFVLGSERIFKGSHSLLPSLVVRFDPSISYLFNL